MPPKKAVPTARGVTTRQRTATADSLKAAEEATVKRLRQEEASSVDSDIEVALEESVSQAEQEVNNKMLISSMFSLAYTGKSKCMHIIMF